MTLSQRLLAVTEALTDAGLAHAFGGAIALAYWTQEPRGTRDLDVNVFATPDRSGFVLDVLEGLGVTRTPDDDARVIRDGQVRLWWEDTPIDLLFDYAPVHADAAQHAQIVPFAGAEIPVLGPVELAVFKVMFDRTKDWADIEAMLAAGTLRTADVRRGLVPMLADDDPRFTRLDDAVRQATGPPDPAG